MWLVGEGGIYRFPHTTIVESGWNVWVWLVGVVSRRRVWLVGEGGIYRFPHTTYPYSSCICSFLQQQPYFLFIKKKFFRSFLYAL